jgi:hypothetical protein
MVTKSVLSNVDLIRRFVFENQPVTMDAIVGEIRRQMVSVKSDELARERYVLPVLGGQPYYRETPQGWEVDIAVLPEFVTLGEVMREEHRLLYEREIRSKIAKKLGLKVHAVVLDLEKAGGLVQHSAHWGLAEWVIANDQAAEVLDTHPGGLNEKDLLKAIGERFGLTPDETVLHLKGDKKKRFVQDRKLWCLQTHYDAKKQEPTAEVKLSLPDLGGKIDKSLEGSYIESQTGRGEEDSLGGDDGQPKARLKKALKKQAIEILEQRDAEKSEDLAARMSQVLSAAGVDEYGVASFQRIESVSKERGLSPKEREEIQQFIGQLLEEDTVGVGAPLASVVNSPLSARKMQEVLHLKYLGYTRDRAVIPNEYYRLLVELLRPNISQAVLHPACFDGMLTIELFNFLFDHLECGAWTMTEDSSNLEIVQADSSRYHLSSKDVVLLEKARDKFIVSQVDLINHFVNYKYSGIEVDKVLASAARIVTRLSGYENAYIIAKDFLTELPEAFNYSPNEENTIPDRFDILLGNFTYTQDANLAANYLDQSLKLLAEGGKAGCFVLGEVTRLLKEHGLLGEFLQGMAVTHVVKLPIIEGRHQVLLLVIKSLESGEETPPIIHAQVADFKNANNLTNALVQGEGEGTLYTLVDPLALTTII